MFRFRKRLDSNILGRLNLKIFEQERQRREEEKLLKIQPETITVIVQMTTMVTAAALPATIVSPAE